MSAESAESFNAITECNRKFMYAFHQGNAKGIAELYTADAQLLPPSSPPIIGQGPIAAFWEEIIQKDFKHLKLKTTELDHLGHTAIEIGRAHIVNESGEVMVAPKYLVVWKDDGAGWKIHRDIWNLDTP